MNTRKNNPEFYERFDRFAFDEVVNEEGQQLDDKTRYTAVLATLIGCGGLNAYREILPKAIEGGVTPVMAREIVYQAADYLGYPRSLNAINCIKQAEK